MDSDVLHTFPIFIKTVIITKFLAAALPVAHEEKWRQKAVWQRVKEFSIATGLQFLSPIIPLVIGDEEKALQASK